MHDHKCCIPQHKHGSDDQVFATKSTNTDFFRAAPDRAVRFVGGPAQVGTARPSLPNDGEGPVRRVHIKSFAIDPYAVTNAWFAKFVEETGYKTEAESLGWSYVFFGFLAKDRLTSGVEGANWWRRVYRASWRCPEGPGSSIAEREDHPVVHVSWNDAVVFAEWAGGRLPDEAEWEYAARGGSGDCRFPWGEEEPNDNGPFLCNIWQGDFPHHNTAGDGFFGTAPVMSFKPNSAGLYNMVGNVWEWCHNEFRIRSLKRVLRARDKQIRAEGQRLMKGGSYLCHRSYCYRYRIAARTGSPIDSSTGHLGFRLVWPSDIQDGGPRQEGS